MSLHVRFVAAFSAQRICGSPGGAWLGWPSGYWQTVVKPAKYLYISKILHIAGKYINKFNTSTLQGGLVQGDPLATGKPTTLEHVHCQPHLRSTNQRKYHPDALFYNCSACVIVKALATRHFVCSFEESVQCDNKWKQCKHLFICIVYK